MTGVCAYNDETAIAVLAGLREQGIAVPVGVAVVGVDDIPTARLAAPPLSTISFDVHEAGRRRAEAIVTALSGPRGRTGGRRRPAGARAPRLDLTVVDRPARPG